MALGLDRASVVKTANQFPTCTTDSMPMGPFAQLLVVVSTTRAFLSRVEPGRILAPVDPNGVGGFESVAVNP